MTNHPKFTESHDSAARSVGYEGAREIRITACENCGRDFANWWNWIRFWNRPVTRFSVGVYCFLCADPKVLFGEIWKEGCDD